jgi:diphthamide synthase (EF-2-diphthine--ammonia ligase)
MITVVDTKRLPEKFLGRILSRETADEIESYGADICGENGEFHTFAFDGPLFKNPVNFSTGEIARSENYSVLPLK